MPSSGKVLRISMSNFELASLKLTAKAPENRPGPKRKGSSSNHPFSGDMLVSVSATPFLLRSCIEILSFNWCASEKTQYLAVPISQLLKFEDFSFSLWCDFKRSYKLAIFGTYETFGSSLIPLFSRFELRTTIFQARVEENGVFFGWEVSSRQWMGAPNTMQKKTQKRNAEEKRYGQDILRTRNNCHIYIDYLYMSIYVYCMI